MPRKTKETKNDFIKNNLYIGESFDDYLKEKLKDDEFRILFEKEKFLRNVSETFSHIRKEKGMTQEEVAKKAGMVQSVVARFESARFEGVKDPREPTLSFLNRMARALGKGISINLFDLKDSGTFSVN